MQEAVTVYLRLKDKGFGYPDEREVLFDLQEQIMQAVADAGVGELDGDLWGEGECILYLYGPDADRLFATIVPLLKSCPLASGGYAIKRYGEASDPDVREVRVTW